MFSVFRPEIIELGLRRFHLPEKGCIYFQKELIPLTRKRLHDKMKQELHGTKRSRETADATHNGTKHSYILAAWQKLFQGGETCKVSFVLAFQWTI